MNFASRYYPSLYKDSVALMKVSAELARIAGVDTAAVVMATAANVENLADAGLGAFEIRPNDLVVAVGGSELGCRAALARAEDLLRTPAASVVADAGSAAPPPTSVQSAVMRDPACNFALVSVPGDYAAAEAMKALRLGLDVMIFSDNVAPAAELALKRFAAERGLMVMGPDCGTAIVNGIPLGFANAVRRGPIGVVGASGTGVQEVTTRIHGLGSGVSQVLGTGGRDLTERIGGLSMRHGLAALAADPDTAVIVLVSKPPAPTVAARVLADAARCGKPVVAVFLGAAVPAGEGVCAAATLAQAADMAVAIAEGRTPRTPSPSAAPAADVRARLAAVARRMAPGQCHARGVFAGGTFCYEAQLIHAAAGVVGIQSNAPVAGHPGLEPGRPSTGHCFIDMGDDEFTRGRPHPMIDPELRDRRLRTEAADPSTAVVLFDVVLGYGATPAPTAGLVPAIATAAAAARATGREIAFIAHVCGTDQDPQDRAAIVTALEALGVLVAPSNADAALWSATLVADCLAPVAPGVAP